MTLSLDKPRVYFSVRVPIDDLRPVHQSQALALILHPRDYDRWLGIPESDDPRSRLDLLHPYDAATMKMTPANGGVWHWRNNGPEMLGGPNGDTSNGN